MPVSYQLEPDLTTEAFIDLLERSGLAERRPLEDPSRVLRMLENSDLILTARDEETLLIGISRCVTDFALCCYCSDLAVDHRWQGQGIGKELLHRSRAAAGENVCFICCRVRRRWVITHMLASNSSICALVYGVHRNLQRKVKPLPKRSKIRVGWRSMYGHSSLNRYSLEKNYGKILRVALAGGPNAAIRDFGSNF